MSSSDAPDGTAPDTDLDPVLARLFRLGNAEADAVATRIDTAAVLASVLAADGAPRRSSRPWRRVVLALACAGVALGLTVAERLWLTALLALVFVVAPALLVLGWHRQARVPGTCGRRRVRRTVPDWADQIDRQGRALARRAGEVRQRLDRLRHIEDMTAAEAQLCAGLGLVDATPSVDDLRRSLGRAAAAATRLADRAAAGALEAQRFARQWLRDPGAARSQYGRLPWTVDPGRIVRDVDALLRELNAAGNEAGDVPLLVALAPRGSDLSAGTRAAEITDAIGVLRRQVQVLRRPLLRECRQLVVAFDILDALATAREIGRISPGTGSKLAATAAVTASTLPQPRARRAAVRTAFLQEAARPAGRPSWRWIGSATGAALAKGFGRTTRSGRAR